METSVRTWLAVTLYWRAVGDDHDDDQWRQNLALYAYIAPVKPEIYYLGQCDRTTVRGRLCYTANPSVWDCINQRSRTHRLIMAEVEVEHRLTRELLADIGSLLIFEIRPCCNVQNISRGNYSYPDLRVECRGEAWPLASRVYWDE